MILQGKTSQYELLTLVSKGKYAWTYLGADDSGQKVFVKRFNRNSGSAALHGFKLEAQLTFNHPNLLPPSELVQKDHALFQIRPFIEGKTLTDLDQKTNVRQLLKIFIDITRALEELHANRIIHRDIKPANILLTNFQSDGCKAVLIDYGQARIRGEADPRPCPFTMMYSSPEQVLKLTPLVTEDSDLFSLGVVMYEILSGSRPYQARHPLALMNLQLTHELPKRRHTPDKLWSVIAKATRKHPFKVPPNQLPIQEVKTQLMAAKRERYQTAREMRMDLESILKIF